MPPALWQRPAGQRLSQLLGPAGSTLLSVCCFIWPRGEALPHPCQARSSGATGRAGVAAALWGWPPAGLCPLTLHRVRVVGTFAGLGSRRQLWPSPSTVPMGAGGGWPREPSVQALPLAAVSISQARPHTSRSWTQKSPRGERLSLLNVSQGWLPPWCRSPSSHSPNLPLEGAEAVLSRGPLLLPGQLSLTAAGTPTCPRRPSAGPRLPSRRSCSCPST